MAFGSPREKRRSRGTPVLRLIENLRLAKAPTTEAMALDILGNCCWVHAGGGFAEILAIQSVKCRKDKDVSVQAQLSSGASLKEPRRQTAGSQPWPLH